MFVPFCPFIRQPLSKFTLRPCRPTKVSLKKNDKILSEDCKLAETLSSFFEIAVTALIIKPKAYNLGHASNLNNSVEVATEKVCILVFSL